MGLANPHTRAIHNAAPSVLTAEAGERLQLVVNTVREISLERDPQKVVSLFRNRAPALYGGDSSVSLSRRDLSTPAYRITRSSRWTEDINPWKEPHRLPLLRGGLLGELLYHGQPLYLPDHQTSPSDPAFEYLAQARSLISLPLFENGEALNMVVRLSNVADGFAHLDMGTALLEANLFGRTTRTLLLAQELQAAYADLDHELRRVAEIQRALLPVALPSIPGTDLAVSYQTARRAGGDYYDFFDLRDGSWGLLIADASGHGTPAAVVMAILRTVLHTLCVECSTASEVLEEANRRLCDQGDRYDGSFVTAFYGIYDPSARTLLYSCAGHHPPLVVDANRGVRELDAAQSVPLAVDRRATFPEASATLCPGDTLILYTDGITEATGRSGECYGRMRLLDCVREDVPNAQHIVDCIVHKLLAFTDGRPAADDRTLVAMRMLHAAAG